jgi:hypothetical protein
VAAEGGPLVTQQEEAEQGVFKPDQLAVDGRYLEDFLEYYAAAFDRLAPELGAESLIRALWKAHSLDLNALPNLPDYGRTDKLNIGFGLGQGQPMMTSCHRFVPDTSGVADGLRPDERDLFTTVAVQLATRHPGMILLKASTIPAHPDLRAAADGRNPKLGSNILGFGYLNTPEAHSALIDPIAGVTTLTNAFRVAAVLGATGDDTVPLGWAILAANLEARPIGQFGPIEAWRRIVDRQRGFVIDLPATESLSITTPDPERIREVSLRHLTRWHDLYTAAGCPLRIDDPDGPQGSRELVLDGTNHGANSTEPTISDEQDRTLCVYDDTAFPQLPNIMTWQYKSVITVSTDSLDIQHPYPIVYSWLPSRRDPRIGIIRDDAGKWRAVQLF